MSYLYSSFHAACVNENGRDFVRCTVSFPASVQSGDIRANRELCDLINKDADLVLTHEVLGVGLVFDIHAANAQDAKFSLLALGLEKAQRADISAEMPNGFWETYEVPHKAVEELYDIHALERPVVVPMTLERKFA